MTLIEGHERVDVGSRVKSSFRRSLIQGKLKESEEVSIVVYHEYNIWIYLNYLWSTRKEYTAITCTQDQCMLRTCVTLLVDVVVRLEKQVRLWR